MLRLTILAFIPCLGLALAGCAATSNTPNRLTMQMTEGPHQELIIRDGKYILVSPKRNVVMVQGVPQTGDGRVRVLVAIHNLQAKNETMLVSSIVAHGGGADGRKAALRVFSYDELMAEQEADRKAQVAKNDSDAAMLSAVSAMAGGTAMMSAARVPISNPNFGLIQSEAQMTVATSEDTIAAAEQERQAKNDSADAGTAVNMEALSRDNLKDHTLLPGEWHGGVVVFQAAPEQTSNTVYRITVPFGGESHEFLITQVAM